MGLTQDRKNENLRYFSCAQSQTLRVFSAAKAFSSCWEIKIIVFSTLHNAYDNIILSLNTKKNVNLAIPENSESETCQTIRLFPHQYFCMRSLSYESMNVGHLFTSVSCWVLGHLILKCQHKRNLNILNYLITEEFFFKSTSTKVDLHVVT